MRMPEACTGRDGNQSDVTPFGLPGNSPIATSPPPSILQNVGYLAPEVVTNDWKLSALCSSRPDIRNDIMLSVKRFR